MAATTPTEREPVRPGARPLADGADQAPRGSDDKATRWSTGRILGMALLLLLTVVYLAPLIWMGLTSFKSVTEATRWPLQWLPNQWLSRAYDLILRPGTATPVLRWFFNSLFSATAHALLVVATAAPAAYALARMNFRGKKLLLPLILATLFIPPIIFLTPNYVIVDRLGWINTLWVVIVPGAAGAFGVFFLRQFFSGLPYEIEEAAFVDGATPFQVFTKVVLPLSKPALATLITLSFLANWNDFLWPFYVLFTPEALTLPPGLGRLQGAYNIDYPVIMAGAVIASIPVLAIFVVAQRFIIEGVARSGLKG
jgi:multiple sugar transport system permease protein